MNAVILMLIAFGVTIAIGIPIAAGLGISAVVALLSEGLPLFMVAQRMMTQVNTFTVMAIMFFILSGEIMCQGSMTEKLINWAMAVVGHIRGGLAIAGGVAATFFSALSGSSAATCASIGSIMIDKMSERGYPKAFSAATIATTGITGIVIPPSVTFVVYGVVTGTSVKKLFAGGILPGLLLAIAFMIVIWYYSKKRGYGAVQKFTLRHLGKQTLRSIPVLMMPLIILGGIYGGVVTPNEAAVISAVYAYIVTAVTDRTLSWKVMKKVLIKTVISTAVIIFIMQMAAAFSWVMTNARIPHMLGQWSAEIGVNKYMFLLAVNVVFLIAGMLITGSAAVSILAPIFLPVALSYGIDPVFLGVVMICNLAIGYITPPVGVNLYLSATIAKVTIEDILKANLPFLLVAFLCQILITLIPQLSLLIPNLIK